MISPDVQFGHGVRLVGFVNLYGCEIGDETFVGPFVEIQRGARVGARCKVESHSFICSGVTIEDGVFIGHGALFTNDRYPRAVSETGETLCDEEWALERILVKERASIGSGAIILPGVTIGRNATVGAGAVVTHDVEDQQIVAGVPARLTNVTPSRRPRD